MKQTDALDKTKLQRILDSIPGKRVLVIGDVMLDEYVWGRARRISPEAPVMVVEVDRDSFSPGGAANVANNVQALGGKSCIIGVVGEDGPGENLARALAECGVNVAGLVTDGARPTTRKTRIIAHNQQVVRVDRESRRELSRRAVGEVVRRIEEEMPLCDVAVFSDYDKGMAGAEVTRAAVESARIHGKRLICNPKPRNIRRFKAASVISVNQSEAETASRIQVNGAADLMRVGKRLVSSLQPETLMITRGAEGISIFDSTGGMHSIPARPVDVYDVAGAGDTVISVLALALAAGAGIYEAAFLTNCAGGAVVRKVGVATVTREEIAAILE